MSLTVLLCEGIDPGEKPAQGLDGRLLNKLLRGVCPVRPRGSKYYMEMNVRMARSGDVPGTFALLDGDFRYPPSPSSPTPEPWFGADRVHLGWRWSRKEVENYLLDPAVVERTLPNVAKHGGRYREALARACSAVARYQAARMALSSVRPRPNTLTNQWGQAHGRSSYLFPDETERTEEACRTQIQGLMAALVAKLRLPKAAQETYEAEATAGAWTPLGEFTSDALMDLALQRYGRLITLCESFAAHQGGGIDVFSGKDLLLAMTSDLQGMKYSSPTIFMEAVIVGIEDSAEEVWTWLPEWTALRDVVRAAGSCEDGEAGAG